MFRIAVLAIVVLVLGAACGLSEAEERYNAGVERSERGEWVEALADYDAAIELDPNGPLPYVNRAADHADLGNFDAALADMTRAIDLGLHEFDSFFVRGRIHCARGDMDRALGDWEVARSLTDDSLLLAALDARIEEGC